jgi:hypothetical protein
MNNKTKKQLADAISNALLHGEFIIKDDSDNGYFERLGYVVIGSDNVMGREPVMIVVTDNDVEITWMHDNALGYDDNGIEGFLNGAMHVIDSSLEPQDVDGNTLTFEYTDPSEQ